WPPQATFADVMMRMNALGRDSGSPSPRSQLMSGPFTGLYLRGWVRRIQHRVLPAGSRNLFGFLAHPDEANPCPGCALRKPAQVLGIDQSQLVIATNGRTVAHGHNRESVRWDLNGTDADGFAEQLPPGRSERVSFQP